jgi:glucuronoarabinoxylan endo-1,4-beta-xylanase
MTTRFEPRRALLVLASLASALAPACIARRATTAGPPGATAPSRAAPTIVLTLDPNERHQVLEGFGASIAWHMQDIIGPTAPDGIYDLLFPALGLDILRFRNRYARSRPEDGNLDEEVEILRRGTAALGHAPKIMLSSWAPPAALKADHHEDCHDNADCTLARENGAFVYDKFARYWADSLARYAQIGIAPDYVTIENEPSFIPPRWEGCKFEPTETAQYPGFDRALVAVHDAIARMSPPLARPPKILAPEVLGIHDNLLQNYIKPMDLGLADGVAHHLYQKGKDGIWVWRSPGPAAFIADMRAAAAATNEPLYQTEFQTDEDRGIDGGFETAWLMHLSIVEEGVVAFLYWNLVWGGQGGLVSINDHKAFARDQYFAVRHYARFTEPGDVRVGMRSDAADVVASAFASPAGDRVTLVVLNTGSSDATIRVDPGAFPAARASAFRTVFRPGKSERWAAVWPEAGAALTGRTLALPPRSMATVVLFR